MKKIFTLLFTITAFFSFDANAQTNDLLKYIPQKAGIVIDIDGGSLSQKVSRQDLMELKFLDSLFKKAKAESKEMFVDPSESGINNHDHFYIIFDMKKDDENGSFTIFGKVSDESKLSQALEKVHDKEVTRKTSGKNKMMFNEDFLIAWNSSVFVAHAGMPFSKHMETDRKLTPAEKKKQLALSEKKCLELLTPKPSINFANKDFEAFIQTKADFKMWIDNKSTFGDLTKNGPFMMFKMNTLLQADHKAIIVNFEKGKVISNTYTYYDESNLSSVQNIYGEKLNAALFKKLPAGNLLGLYALSFNPGGVKNFAESSGLLEKFKEKEEASLDSLIKQKKPHFDPMIILDNLKGDVIAAVTFADRVYDDEGGSKSPFSNFNIFFAATVKDEMKVNKFIDSIKAAKEEKRKEVDTLEDGQIIKNRDFFKDVKSSMKVEDGVFYLTITPSGPEQINTASTNKYDELYKEFGQRPTLMILDIKALMSMAFNMENKMRHTEGQPDMAAIFEVFDKMAVSGGKFENNAMITTQEVKFTNANENSLKQMLKMFDLLFSAISNMKSKVGVRDLELKDN